MAQPYARRTIRSAHLLEKLVVELGGKAGARICQILGIPQSPSSLLRILQNASKPQFDPPRILGVDDFAFRKGATYRTVLVDLERRQIIDLLPNRKAETLKEWLKDQPQVEAISRDRAGAFAQGASLGAPQAIQIADRWHLFKNLGVAIERFLVGKSSILGKAAPAKLVAKHDKLKKEPLKKQETKEQRLTRLRREGKWKRVLQAQSLHKKGHSISAVARQMNIDPKTVRKYLRMDSVNTARSSRRKALDEFKTFLWKRWQKGSRNLKILFTELRERGYQGS